MLDPRNNGNLTAGLVQAPELIDMKNGKIVKLRLAVPFAGKEKDSDDRRGFFDAVYYAHDDDANAKFVLSQIEAGNFKPGTTLSLLYQLSQERWGTDDGKKNSKVVLVVGSIAYAGSAPRRDEEGGREESPAVTAASKF